MKKLLAFFGVKESETQKQNNETVKKALEPSKGYHSCVDTCETDIENLETECENLRKDNLVLIGKVTSSQASSKEKEEDCKKLSAEVIEKAATIISLNERIEELEKRLEEADERADGTPVKYASARKTMTKAKLKQLRERLEAVPANAGGFGGSVSIYDKKTKRVSVVEFKSKADAIAILEKAEKGNVEIIM
jgi:chromosome segregation ATPase